MTIKQIKVFGTKVQYKNVPQLANALNIGDDVKTRRENAKQAIRNLNTKKVIYDNITGDFDELKLSDKPLLIRQFTGVRRATKRLKNDILTSGATKDINLNNNDITIKDNDIEFKNDDILNFYCTAWFRIVLSETDGTLETNSERHTTFNYRGFIDENDYKNLRHIIIDYGHNNVSNIKYRYNPIMTEESISNGNFYDKSKKINYDDQSPFIRSLVDNINRLYQPMAYKVYIDTVVCQSISKRSEFLLETMKLRYIANNANISNLYNEVIPITNKDDPNCVINYLTQKYKKIAVKKYFNKYVIDHEDNGITTLEIKEFCKRYNIKMIAYNINGVCISKNKINKDGEIKKGADRASLIYIAYMSHIFPVKNKLLNKVIYPKDIKEERLTYNQVKKKFDELLSNNIIPSNITISTKTSTEKKKEEVVYISSFVNNNTLYYYNNDYTLCYDILKQFQLTDQMTPHTNRYNIMNILETLYGVKDTLSFFPMLSTHSGLRYDYMTSDKELLKREKEFKSLDKCKAYGYALHSLKFIQTIDIRKHKELEEKDLQTIDPLNCYIATPAVSSYLMPNTGFYTGEQLLYYSKTGLKFKINNGWSCDTQENPYKNLIKDYYEKTTKLRKNEYNETEEEDDEGATSATIKHKETASDIIKSIINIFIGKFDQGCDDVKCFQKVTKLCNLEESLLSDGHIINYNDDYKIVCEQQQRANIYTKKLIKYQLLNQARIVIYEKMEELGLRDKDIIQIKTDSITFISSAIKKPFENIGDGFKQWKIDKYDGDFKTYFNDQQDEININEIKAPFNSSLYLGYAGCGKSYQIINKLIPSLGDNYIVLSPSHSSIEDYRLLGLNCDVIQKYCYSGEVPTQKHIIIDEIGLCNTTGHNIIYKCMLLNKKVYLFGDYNQLEPVADVHCNSDIYHKYAFKNIYYIKTNMRNNFTIEYYDSLIENKINLKDEIIKHNTNINDAEYIVCPTNVECDEYNELIMKKLKIDMHTLGCKVMCKTNKLRKYDIYNNFMFDVIGADDDHVYIKDRTRDYKIPRKLYDNKFNFKPAYARTIYNLQGKSISSYHVPDKFMDYFAQDGRIVYTLISRLKQTLNKTIEQPKIKQITKSKKRGVPLLII